MSEPFLAPILNILITKKIKSFFYEQYLLFADSGAGDEQAGDHRGPVPHLCPGNDDNDDDNDNDNNLMIMPDGSARAGHLPGPGDLLSLLGPRNLQRQQKCT